MAVDNRRTVEERFWAKVQKSEGCWLWAGGTKSCGNKIYGGFNRGAGVMVGAHQFAYELACGPIPPRHMVDHTCHVGLCVRPDHLRAVTRKQNAENLQGLYSNNTSGFQGVSWSKNMKRWRAELTHNKKHVVVGYFTDKEEAARAVQAKRNELFTHNDQDR